MLILAVQYERSMEESSVGEYLTNEEIKKMIIKIQSGDNEAWESLYHNFERYVHDRAWNRLRKFDISESRKKDMEEELYQAGWQGFLSCIHYYDPKKGEFLTYATHYIDGEMSKEINFVLNPLGFTERVKPNSGYAVFQMPRTPESGISVEEAPDLGKYSEERRVLQIMEVLRLLTDEEHSLSKEELVRLLHLYRIGKYHNGTPLEKSNTLTSTIEDILAEVNPLEYTSENDGDYKVKYEGYKENRLKAKWNKEKGKKAADITEFSYVHTFDNAELDSLIQLICFSDMFSNQEKQRLVNKLVSTASVYYRTPFQSDEEPENILRKLRFNPKAIHGRFSG